MFEAAGNRGARSWGFCAAVGLELRLRTESGDLDKGAPLRAMGHDPSAVQGHGRRMGHFVAEDLGLRLAKREEARPEFDSMFRQHPSSDGRSKPRIAAEGDVL